MFDNTECMTPLCHKNIKPDSDTEWQRNEHCKFTKAFCYNCGATYWIVKRNDRLSILYRNGEEFDHRTELRNIR